MAFPQTSTSIDNFNRADGTLQAGGGATLWTASALGGGSGNWSVSTNKAIPNAGGANHLSLFTLPADMELVAKLATVGSGVNYIAIFFALQSADSGSWEGYWLYYEPSSGWDLKKRVGGTTTVLAHLTAAESPVPAAGDLLGIHRVDDAIKIRWAPAGVWDQTPIIDVVDDDIQAIGPIALEAAGAFAIDDLVGGAATPESGDPGGGDDPTEPVTIYVDADHPDANDTHTRLQASDPDMPLKTLQAAAMLAFATADWADTIQIEPAATANALDTKDPAAYAGLHHRITGSDILPFGDNTGNEPITVQGHIVAGHKPKVAAIDGRQLKNWTFQDLQQGYDIGSGDDNLTIGTLTDVADLVFRRVDYTGGGYDIKVWDEILFEECLIRSPYSAFQGSGNRYLDGVGFHISYINPGDGLEGVGLIHFLRCVFDDINGEDAIQAYLGGIGGAYADGHLLVEGCVFTNVIGVPGKAHCDSIQILGGQLFEIRDSVFFNCDDAFIASDYHNAKIIFENNLVAYCGVPCSSQGTDELVLRHNTIINSFYGTAVAVVRRTEGITQKVTMVNNVLDDYSIADDVLLHPASVISNNIVLRAPGANGNLAGTAEFGTSARMAALPAFTSDWAGAPANNYELANTPTLSPGIGQGIVTDLEHDRLGRAYSNPPDVGCHQSDPATLVSPATRPPYVQARVPGPSTTGVSRTTNITALLLPRPGAAINPATVTPATFYITDPSGTHLPVIAVIVNDPNDDGQQLLSADVDGLLFPFVQYTVHLAATIADTDGSALGASLTWTFQTAGLGGPAVDGAAILDESGIIVISPPVPAGGPITLIAGDDYADDDERAITFTDTNGDWPDLSAADIGLEISGPTGITTIFSGALKGTDQVIVELTADETDALEHGRGRYDLFAIASGDRRITLVRGFTQILPSP